MSSLVPSGVEKGITSKNGKSGVEVTVHETVPEHDVSHQDEETLEILQGNFWQPNFSFCDPVVSEQFFFSKTRKTKVNVTHLFLPQPIRAMQFRGYRSN